MREGAIDICKKLELTLKDCANSEAIKAGIRNTLMLLITSIESNKKEACKFVVYQSCINDLDIDDTFLCTYCIHDDRK